MRKVVRYEDRAGVLHETAEDAAVGDAWADVDQLVAAHVQANQAPVAKLIGDFLRANGQKVHGLLDRVFG